jgi:hypothetical protein
MSAYVEREARFAKWFGWTPAPRNPVSGSCPRYAARKQCLALHRDCICQRFSHRVIDHAATWRTSDGERVWTSEPYDVDAQELAEFEREVETLGLHLFLSPRSGWFNGEALLLIVKGSPCGP